MRLVRLGGVLTLAGLAGLIFVLRRSERRRDAQPPRPAPVGEPR
jgi:hypothetical protein